MTPGAMEMPAPAGRSAPARRGPAAAGTTGSVTGYDIERPPSAKLPAPPARYRRQLTLI
jgi:hypothetical protein